MNTALAKFMSVAVTAVIIVGLVFGALYSTIQGKTTGTTGYDKVVTGADTPTKSGPTSR